MHILFLFLSCLLFLTFRVEAQEVEHLDGVPVIEQDSSLLIDGQKIHLWGVVFLATDQPCWNNHVPWPCGEQAFLTLRHHAEGQKVSCHIKERMSATAATAQCFMHKKGVSTDMGQHMIRQGWAFADPLTAGGEYELEQAEAQNHRRGIWTSDFQTPEDWKNGVERFIREREE